MVLAAVAAPVAVAVGAGALTGHVLLLAVLVGVGARSGATGVAASLAALSLVVRFGTPDLDAIGGAQAVLGPAGLVGPGAAAASAWLGGSAVVLAAAAPLPGRGARLLGALAAGALAAVLVAAPGDQPVLRLGATALAAGAAFVVTEARARWRAAGPALAAVALLAGAGALLCALLA